MATSTSKTPAKKASTPASKPAAKKPAAKSVAKPAAKSVAKSVTKPAAKKPVAAKTARPAAPKKVAAPKSGAMTGQIIVISDEQRYRMIAEAAYYRAESNHFKSDPVRDWIEAEAQIAALLGNR